MQMYLNQLKEPTWQYELQKSVLRMILVFHTLRSVNMAIQLLNTITFYSNAPKDKCVSTDTPPSPNDNISNGGSQFTYEKPTNPYEMAKREVSFDKIISISDCEYAVAGQGCHENINSNLYAHSVDNVYDSSAYTRKQIDDGNLYDHCTERNQRMK